jgi:hypothetical protein
MVVHGATINEHPIAGGRTYRLQIGTKDSQPLQNGFTRERFLPKALITFECNERTLEVWIGRIRRFAGWVT